MALEVITLVGLFCLSLAASSIPSSLSGYRPGNRYSYDFNGQISSSLSNGEDFSAIRIRSELNLDFLDDDTVQIKLQRNELATFNGYLEQELIQSFQKFEQLDVKPEHVSQLDLPFEIQYENGRISELKFHREDSVWSENIKRSIANLLQVQLGDSISAEQRYPSYFYQSNETTIEGECETSYHIDDSFSDSVEEAKSTINITKTINFEKCLRRPELRYNYYRHSEPLDWNTESSNYRSEQNSHSMEPAVDSISQYEISLENNLIQISKVLSRYSYDLVDKDHVSLTTFSIGQIVFKNSEKRRSADANEFPKKSAQSLVFSNELDLLKERFITQGNEEYLKQNPYIRLDNAVDVVKNIMRTLVRSSIEREGPEGIEEDAARQFTHLVSILRLCSKSDIQQIHEKLFMNTGYTKKTEQFVKEVLADALAVAGTKISIDHLVEKIEKEEISPSKASRALEKLYKLRMTSEQMVKPIWKLCNSEIARNNENLKRTCYLSWGAMVNAMCGHDHNHGVDHENWAISSSKEKICPTTLKQQYIQDVMQLYQQSSGLKSDKVLFLKTLGNMGIDDSIAQLEKIITDKSEDRLVRIHALDALRNLRDQVPQKVQRLLTPVFRDRREHPEIRMNAFQEILHTRPDSALLHLLCAEMAHETNVDVKSFVVSSIKRLAENSDNILNEKTSNIVKSCLMLLEQMDESFVRQSASKKHQFGLFSEPSNWHEFGSLFTFASIFSNDSYLPKEIMASFDLLMNGRFIPNTWQIGVHMQGLEEITTRLSQKIGTKEFDDIITRGRRSLVSEYNPIEMLKSLFNKMQLVARRRSSTDSEMFLIYRRHNNLDYSFFLLDEANLPDILKKLIVEGRLDVSKLEEKDLVIRTNEAMYNVESQMKLPTTMGIPMVVTSRIATVGFIEGKYSLSFGTNEKVRDAKVALDVHPQLATSIIVKMEVFSPLFTSGVKTIHSLQARLPINTTIEIKYPNLVPTFTWIFPEQETRLLHLQSRPITFLRVWPQKSNVFIDAKEKTLLIPELDRHYTTNDFEARCPFTGIRFGIESHGYQHPSASYDWAVSGENALEIRLKPTQKSAKMARLSGQRMDLTDSQATPTLESIFNQQPALFQGGQDEDVQALKDHIHQSTPKVTDFKKISVKLETVSSENDNTITMDLKTACDKNGFMCVFEKDIKADIGNSWSWKTIAQLAQPEIQAENAPVKSGYVVGTIETSWGSRKMNTVTVNLYGKPSTYQIDQFKSLLNKKADDSGAYEQENILDEKFEGLQSKLKPNQFNFAIEHQVTDETIQSIMPYYNWMKSCPKANVYIPDLTKIDETISRRHSTLTAQITYDNYVNLTLNTPEEQLEMVHWDSGKKLSQKSKTILDLLSSNQDDFAKCSYKREQIETFDGQLIDIPLTTCYALLAKDCGGDDSKFAIMAKKMSKDGEEFKVKFITQKNELELYKDGQTNNMVLKANNIIVRKEEYNQYNIHTIESTGSTIYEIKSKQAQVILRFDGQKISIQIADIYMNRQCGICGHMNNDREDDFLKHDNSMAKSVSDFHLSYLYRDGDECEPAVIQELENMKSKSQRRHLAVENIDDQGRKIRQPFKKTSIVEKRDTVCFSLKPVPTCPSGFENDSNGEQKEVGYKCFKRESSEAQQNLRNARENVLELDDQDSDYTEQVNFPSNCIKY